MSELSRRLPAPSSGGTPEPPTLTRNDWSLVRLLVSNCRHSDASFIVKKIDASLSEGYGLPPGVPEGRAVEHA